MQISVKTSHLFEVAYVTLRTQIKTAINAIIIRMPQLHNLSAIQHVYESTHHTKALFPFIHSLDLEHSKQYVFV